MKYLYENVPLGELDYLLQEHNIFKGSFEKIFELPEFSREIRSISHIELPEYNIRV